jgi:hypothetical protein
MKIIIPLYDLSYANQIINFSKKYKFVVIVNPNDGPGNKIDNQWLNVIKSLKSNSIEIYGYIDTVKWDSSNKSSPKTIPDMIKERDLYKQWYNVSKYFLDDYTEKTHKPFNDESIANPGCDVKTDCEYTVIWETENYLHSSMQKNTPSNKSIVISMNDRDYKSTMDLAKRRNIQYFYSVNAKDNWNAYNKLPSYLEDMLKYTN